MFPPVDDQVLQNNPEFAKLYKTLTTSVLYPNGLLKRSKETKEYENIRKQADQRRLRAAKHHLLHRAIATSSPIDTSSSTSPSVRDHRTTLPTSTAAGRPLSESVIDLLLLLPPLLDAAASPPSPPPPSPLSPSSLDLSSAALLLNSEPFLTELLPRAVPALAALLSTTLHASALSLAQLITPPPPPPPHSPSPTTTTTDPALARRHIPALEHNYAVLRARHAAAHAALLRARAALTASLISSSSTPSFTNTTTPTTPTTTSTLPALVRTLETKHGAVAHSLELRAAETSLRARRAHARSAHLLSTVLQRDSDSDADAGSGFGSGSTAGVGRALAAYALHLGDARVRGAERVRNLERELSEYGVHVGQDYDHDHGNNNNNNNNSSGSNSSSSSGGGGNSSDKSNSNSNRNSSAKEKLMRELARAHQEIGRQVDEVTQDLERLHAAARRETS